MFNRLLMSFVALTAAAAVCVPAAFAQASRQAKISNWGGQAEGPAPKLPPPDANAKFDPHDFSGVYETNHSSTRGYRGMTTEENIPPRTPWAEQIFRSRLTGRPTKEKPVCRLHRATIRSCNAIRTGFRESSSTRIRSNSFTRLIVF